MARVPPDPPVEAREFRSVDEIDRSIKKLERRVSEVESLNAQAAVMEETGAETVVESNVRETIREIFGNESAEFREHRYLRVWAGSMWINMPKHELVAGIDRGKTAVAKILRNLIDRLREKREDLEGSGGAQPSSYFSKLNLHARIAVVANDLYSDGYHSEAVFAAAKALVNLVKEKSGQHELDGAALMRTVFSKNNPVLFINDLATTTDLDEQEGMMHLFEGAVLAIRNPGGHSFPQGSSQRAMEYIQLLSLLAYQVDEAKRRQGPKPAT
jgi:uncharacterized protein (TIGR02391 family)